MAAVRGKKHTGSNNNRCWAGYEPVPGKKQHSQGSCRPKSDVDLSAEEKQFRTARKQQLDRWEKSHPKSPRKAAQHLHAPKSGSRKRGKGRS